MQKKGIFIAASIVVILAALILINARENESARTNKHLAITVTTNIIADAVKQIAGDKVKLHCLMQPGIDPHSYHARLSDLRMLLDADIIFYNGLHLEGKMATILHKMHSIKPTFPVSDALHKNQLISSDEFEEIYDPHIWFDVSLWKQVIIFITETLCRYDAQHASYFQERLSHYLQDLDLLDNQIKNLIALINPDQRFLITTHDAFSYFGRRYNFNVIGLQGINLDAEPCIKNMKDIIDLICLHNIPVIFVESSLPHRSMQAIAQAVHAHGHTISIGDELYSDTLGPSGSNADSYIGMLMHNTLALVSGLNPLYTVT